MVATQFEQAIQAVEPTVGGATQPSREQMDSAVAALDRASDALRERVATMQGTYTNTQFIPLDPLENIPQGNTTEPASPEWASRVLTADELRATIRPPLVPPEGLSALVTEMDEEKYPTKTKRVIPKKKMTPAEVLLYYSDIHAEKLKVTIGNNDSEINQSKAQLKTGGKKLEYLEMNQEFLVNRHKKIEEVYIKKDASEYDKTVLGLTNIPLFESIHIDAKKRIVVTTKPISVKMKEPIVEGSIEKVEVEKVAGKYQIRIDFSQENAREGIEIINITQRFEGYQSPTISGTRCCLGDFSSDLQRDFDTCDLHELISDLIDYIASPNDKNGYTRWVFFFEKAKPLPKNYSFLRYDIEKRKGQHENGPTEAGFGSTLEHLQNQLGNLEHNVTAQSTLSPTLTTATTGASSYYRVSDFSNVYDTAISRLEYQHRGERPRPRRDRAEEMIAYALEQVGLRMNDRGEQYLARVYNRYREISHLSYQTHTDTFLRRIIMERIQDESFHLTCLYSVAPLLSMDVEEMSPIANRFTQEHIFHLYGNFFDLSISGQDRLIREREISFYLSPREFHQGVQGRQDVPPPSPIAVGGFAYDTGVTL